VYPDNRRTKILILHFSNVYMLKLIIIVRPFARYLFIFWLLTIIILSSIPNVPTIKLHTAKTEFRLDYLMHFCEYSFLTFLTFLSFAGWEFKFSTRKIILIALSLMLFAFLDELHQKLIPGRSYNIMDILSNESGILAGTLFILFVFRAVKNRLIKPEYDLS